MNIVKRTYCVDATLNVETGVLTLVFQCTNAEQPLTIQEKRILDSAIRTKAGEVLKSSVGSPGDLEMEIEDLKGIEAETFVRDIIVDVCSPLMKLKLAWDSDKSSLTLKD